MKNIKNISLLDRYFRFIFAELLFILWFFWIWGYLQIIFFVISFVLILTSITWFCYLYKLIWINTIKKEKTISKFYKIWLIALFILLAILWSYYSNFFTKKIFLEDYNTMNNYYKQTLFNTWKDNREESINNYNLLLSNYNFFSNKYLNYKPYVLKWDKNLDNDLLKIWLMIDELDDQIINWDLLNCHLALEKIRPIFQDILKRNNFSMLAVSLVDFHDVMEKVIDAATEKDINLLDAAYIEADEKLKVVELEANDEEIIAIRKSLNEIKSLADEWKYDKLADKAQELKSNFIKVYLKRG